MSRDDERSRRGERPDDEGFLNRWSRRKAEARAQEATPAATAEAAPAAEDAPEPEAPLDLPDIESLTAESDFKVFMAKGVPQHLRNQALRKLWRLKPSLANLDGLLDYGGDYTRSAMVPAAAVRTAYQVGKGYLRDEPKAPDQVTASQARELPEAAAPPATRAEGPSGSLEHGPPEPAPAPDKVTPATPAGAAAAGQAPSESEEQAGPGGEPASAAGRPVARRLPRRG